MTGSEATRAAVWQREIDDRRFWRSGFVINLIRPPELESLGTKESYFTTVFRLRKCNTITPTDIAHASDAKQRHII